MLILQTVLSSLAVISALCSVYYSFRARRAADSKGRGLLTARMNISMGLMLICIALIQLFLFPGSWVRISVGLLFLLLGCFNLFAGIRNHAWFRA